MDESLLIGVYISNIEFLVPDVFFYQPTIDGYLIDKKSGTCIEGNSSDSNIFSYTNPYSLNHEKSSSQWNKLLVIDSDFTELNSENKILFFEIWKNVLSKKTKQAEKKRLAWAFLVPLASDGSLNTNQNLKLQLYKIRKDCKISHQDCNIYHLYADHKLKKYLGYLEVSVKGVLRIKAKPENKKQESIVETKVEEKLTIQFSPIRKPISKIWEWTRLPTQSCKVPNTVYRTHNLGKGGVSCAQFSRSGLKIAAAILSQIVIYEVLTGEEVVTLNSHVGFIYELDWCLDDEYLLSVSNDCRGAVWNLKQKTPVHLLPHPSYVYCGRWFGSTDQIVTGGKDHVIRYWRRSGDSFDLIDEITGHPGFVSALTTQDSSFVFSGDSRGCVMIRKFSEGNWVLLKQFFVPETCQNVIDSIHLHCSRRRMIVSVRSRGSYLVDVASGITLQTYKSAVNPLARSMSSLTPCGSFLFSFCHNGDVGVWETNTGKVFAIYENLFPTERLTELSGSIHYHPFEHMVAITALGPNYPLLILKCESSKKDDSKRLGLVFKHTEKKMENDFSIPLLTSRSVGRVSQ